MKGLYIHIPFCVQKCRYCDFVSYCGKLDCVDLYLDALINEMQRYKGEKTDTVFIGGGTPTVLNEAQLERLCKAVFENFNVADGYEFSIEANPGTIDFNKAHCLYECGVNRISIGVQSFNDDELVVLGRIHDAKTAYDTVIDVNRAGFDNINIDLMSALPYQTKERLMNTLKTAVELPIKHISAYSLILEEGTPLFDDYMKKSFEIPDEDADREMYAAAVRYLTENGFNQYEISNFAKSGYECRHNIKYWECREYIGLGAAAHSYVNFQRYENTASLEKYISGDYRTGEITALDKNDRVFEFIMMGLRMNKGISEAEFEKRFGIKFTSLYAAQLERFAEGGFVEMSDGYIRFTDKGRNVSNSILCEFIDG